MLRHHHVLSIRFIVNHLYFVYNNLQVSLECKMCLQKYWAYIPFTFEGENAVTYTKFSKKLCCGSPKLETQIVCSLYINAYIFHTIAYSEMQARFMLHFILKLCTAI